jgi:hypothetical protein
MSGETSYEGSSTPPVEDKKPDKPSISYRKRGSRSARISLAALALTAGAGAYALTHSGSPAIEAAPAIPTVSSAQLKLEYDSSTETAMEALITPQAGDIAAALKALSTNPDNHIHKQEFDGFVEYSGTSENEPDSPSGQGSFDAVINDASGKVVYADVELQSQQGPNKVDEHIALSSPEGAPFVERANLTNAAKNGEAIGGNTAFQMYIVTDPEGNVDTERSDYLDTTSSQFFVKTDNDMSTDPVTTTKAITNMIASLVSRAKSAFGTNS